MCQVTFLKSQADNGNVRDLNPGKCNRMGNTRDAFKKIGGTKGTFHAKIAQ